MIIKGLSRLGAFFLFLISLLPFWFLYIISDFLYLMLYHIAGYRKKVVRDNLSRSFPEKSAPELLKIEKQYYRYLCDLMMETIKMLTISKTEVERRMAFTTPDTEAKIAQLVGSGRHIIGAAGHYGNWELAALRFSTLVDINRIIVYKPLHNQTFNTLFKNMRERYGATLVAMKDVLRKLVSLRNEQMFTTLVSDQTPVQESVQYFTTFLNQPTAVFLGVEKLAKSLDAIVVFCDVRCVKRGYYSFDFALLTDTPKQTAEHQITDMHVAYLENMIKLAPQYWLWSHRRWKFKPKNL